METASAGSSKFQFIVVAYPKEDAEGFSAMAWGKVNGKEGWIPLSGDIVKTGVNAAQVALLSSPQACEVRDNAKKYAQGDTHSYLILNAKEFQA